MPYIAVRTSKTLNSQQKDEIKAALGEVVTRIPGKKEAQLMVDISDSHTMYFGGVQRELAYFDVKCYGTTEFEHKKDFTEAVFQAAEKIMQIPEDGIYLTYSEFSNWGTKGSMK